MARSSLAVELNTFVAGLITEATPLTFPANASLDEDNFVLNRKGSRQRRLGMDFEDGHVSVETDVTLPMSGSVPITYHRWRNAGGISSRDLLVVQVANQIKVFDQNTGVISQSQLFTYSFDTSLGSNKFSYAVVDGLLVIATGSKEVAVLQYIAPSSFSVLFKRLLVRDQFGVEDIFSGDDLREGNGVAVRPGDTTLEHVYNLRNQTWAQPRKPDGDEEVTDPILEFFEKASKYPSNSDAVNYALYADTNDGDDRLTERFIAKDLVANPVGTFPAPRGFFIIDALDRGNSRVTEYAKLLANNPSLGFTIPSLKIDSTPSGASAITEYAGRVWYAGFSGDLVDGDAHSPRMASYVLFSSLVDGPSDIVSCYQSGDPTSKEEPELLDTDGGFIRIDGAYGIVRLVNIGNALMVIAHNGVWMIQGGSDYGFKATNYLVTKLTGRGCDSPDSLVVVDNTFMYWSDDGIYTVSPNQFGDYEANNLTRNTIQSLYDSIDAMDKVEVKGVYDNYTQKVRWIFHNRLTGEGEVREIILDLSLGAFYTNSIKNLTEVKRPIVIGGFTMPPFLLNSVEDIVVVDSVPVTVSGSSVFVELELPSTNLSEIMYLIVTSTSPTVSFSFGIYKNPSFRDWASINGVGVDAKAHLLTGWMSGGDNQRYKQVPYTIFHFNKTEDGFEEDVNGDWVPTNQSSCKVSSQWDWSNSAVSGQWGKQFQAYRFKRHFIPADISDPYNNGYQTVVTKNKIRGKGRVLSLLVETEPDKDCQLLGWSMVMTSNGNI